MFYWSIELLLTGWQQGNGETHYEVVVELKSDPGLKKEDEVWINKVINHKKYYLKTKVVGKRKQAYSPDENLSNYGEEAIKKGLLLERIFVEAEDRDAILEITESLQKYLPPV